MMNSPRALLLDLDDTILDDSRLIHDCWRDACASFADRLTPLAPGVVVDAIRERSTWFWGDPERHRIGRLELRTARREVVRLALETLGITDPSLAAGIGDEYSDRRDHGMKPLPAAIDTVIWLRASSRRLALLTNGAGAAQRQKIERFGLTDLFDAILVEGEVGVGKPEELIYRQALSELDVQPSEAWMVGDNLEWDVAAPQKLGIAGVWIDVHGKGLPETSAVKPDYIVRALSDLRDLPPMR